METENTKAGAIWNLRSRIRNRYSDPAVKTRQFIPPLCTLLLIILWIIIVLDRIFLHLGHNYHMMLQESLSHRWGKEIFWILFIFECVCLTLLLLGFLKNPKSNKIKPWGFALSTFMLFGFMLYIWLSMWDWYIHRPCNCPGFFAYLNWNNRMVCNISFLLVSIVGWWLSHGTAGGTYEPEDEWREWDATDQKTRRYPWMLLYQQVYPFINVSVVGNVYKRLRYPRRFALFPGRPVGNQLIPQHTLDSMGAASRMDAGGPRRRQSAVKPAAQKTKKAQCKSTGPNT